MTRQDFELILNLLEILHHITIAKQISCNIQINGFANTRLPKRIGVVYI